MPNAASVVLMLSRADADTAFLEMILTYEERTGAPMPIDSLIILSRLRQEQRLTTADLVESTQKSEPATRSTLEHLVEAGLVGAHGAGRGRSYTLSAKVYKKAGQKAAYVRQAGFNPIQQEQMVLAYSDTIAITVGGLEEWVRLIGIDTPERDTPFGPHATAFMRELLRPGAVWLELDARERDRFGRLLAYAYVEDATHSLRSGQDGIWAWRERRFTQANLAIAQAGWADLLTIPPNVRYTELFVAAVREARAAGLGMWAAQEACVDINRADIPALTRIVHIDTERAQQIVELREQRPFRSVDELTRVRGIGEARLRDIKAQGLACVP